MTDRVAEALAECRGLTVRGFEARLGINSLLDSV
jgi:hypothetical protein